MKTKILILLLAITSVVKSQNCDVSNHFYVGAGIGYGNAPAKGGMVVQTAAGYATPILGIDGSISSFPNPSAPSFFALHLTKPFFYNNNKLTVGLGSAYQLVNSSVKEQNGFKPSAYLEVSKISDYSNMMFYGRAAVTGGCLILTIGLQGCFKRN